MKVRLLFCSLGLLLLSACSAAPSTTTPGATNPGQTTSPATLRPTITQAAAASTQTAPPAISTLLPSATPIPQEPVLLGARFLLLDWSPDSSTLTFILQTPQDIASSTADDATGSPPGSFHFYNVLTGEGCEYPADNERKLAFNSWHAWLPDGKFAVLTESGTLIALDKPCGGQVVALSAREKNLVRPPEDNTEGVTYSPGGTYRSFTTEEPPGYTTTIARSSNGEKIITFSWTLEGAGSDQPPDPVWIAEDKLILSPTNNGPLWITLGDHPSVQPISKTFFDLTGTPQQTATGAVLAGSDRFHIVLQDPGAGPTDAQTLLYHSGDGSVENLPYKAASFSADGRLLDLVSNTDDLWVRPVDPAGSEALKIIGPDDQRPPGWTGDHEMVAIARKLLRNMPVAIIARAIPSGEVRYTWQMSGQYGYYNYDQLIWSPDKQLLALVGSDLNNQYSQALFVLSTARADAPSSVP